MVSPTPSSRGLTRRRQTRGSGQMARQNSNRRFWLMVNLLESGVLESGGDELAGRGLPSRSPKNEAGACRRNGVRHCQRGEDDRHGGEQRPVRRIISVLGERR